MPTTSTCSINPVPFTLHVFPADAHPDLADLYRAGQADSYRRHPGSLAALLPGNLLGALVVLARAPDGSAHAGMRVHLRRPGQPLPVEHALGDRCPLGPALDAATQPLVELCGTWVSAAFRGSDLAVALTRAALAAARTLAARRIVGCAHQHVLGFYQRFGAVADPSLGVHAYPDPRYRTTVFWADPEHLASACPEEHAIILALAGQLARGEPLRHTLSSADSSAA